MGKSRCRQRETRNIGHRRFRKALEVQRQADGEVAGSLKFGVTLNINFPIAKAAPIKDKRKRRIPALELDEGWASWPWGLPDRPSMLKLTDIRKDALLKGIVPSQAVKVVSVEPRAHPGDRSTSRFRAGDRPSNLRARICFPFVPKGVRSPSVPNSENHHDGKSRVVHAMT